MAREYIPSPCPSTDLCCRDNWPYATEFHDDDGYDLYQWLFGYGALPWDRDRAMVATVTIDPALVAGEFTMTCSDPAPDYGPSACDGFGAGIDASFPGTLVLSTQIYWFGWLLEIEVDVTASTPRARICTWPYTDALDRTCEEYERPVCATAATVTLDRLPAGPTDLAGLRVAFTSVFADGSTVEGSFALP